MAICPIICLFYDLARALVHDVASFSSPEAALLLVSTKNRELWPSPTPEVRDSRTSRHSAHVQSQVWQIWLVLVSIYCVYKAIQKRNAVGPGQRSRFLVLTKRSAASGDENGRGMWICVRSKDVQKQLARTSLNRVGKSAIFVLNRVRVWGAVPHLPTQRYI